MNGHAFHTHFSFLIGLNMADTHTQETRHQFIFFVRIRWTKKRERKGDIYTYKKYRSWRAGEMWIERCEWEISKTRIKIRNKKKVASKTFSETDHQWMNEMKKKNTQTHTSANNVRCHGKIWTLFVVNGRIQFCLVIRIGHWPNEIRDMQKCKKKRSNEAEHHMTNAIYVLGAIGTNILTHIMVCILRIYGHRCRHRRRRWRKL